MIGDSRRLRRDNLIQLMGSLEQEGTSCRDCSGVCCTFVGNSMQITPLEAWDLHLYLVMEKRWTVGLEERLLETIKNFRLDQPVPSNGLRNFARRRYTCPFFKDQALGCSIAPEWKPYGCLGFNARSGGVKDGENCSSRLDALEAREHLDPNEANDNNVLREKYQWSWQKLSIPEALMAISQEIPFNQSPHN
ncbi:hypothetical protein [Pseudobacteriovorax antillogorgiicola]|uniref:Uncharacterized protein n=1 Tax=Pseudobacteriovorax antillogorgiicola TaxID=1513793 RepID=A0A1Y6CMP7_9BACT|nr:hypothetical protein [Pseudobacteriovorax antillogorgiicola]TCS44600.1 hypothetical protein EDD56_13233 [Pseudobacteriovorax antillogorgiicola]SMF78163.1 hypothetical protein SAMN06296036_13233 [Pseudobacteriovorax antillogorgiicola]